MRKFLLAISVVVVSSCVTSAQQPLSTNSPLISVVDFGATCNGAQSIGVASAIATAISIGWTKIRLPQNCWYFPPSNTTPANFEIDGDDWNTSYVSVANRSTDTLQLGSKSILRNVAVISHFCDTNPQPSNTQKVCPVGVAANVSDTTNALTNWVYQQVWIIAGPSVTGPSGVSSHDIPGIATTISGAGGDAIYSEARADQSSALRAVTSGAGAQGVYIINGLGDATSNKHLGLWLQEFSDATGAAYSAYINRVGSSAGVAPSLHIDDASGIGPFTSPFIDLSVGAPQTGGNIISIYQGAGTFSGDLIHANVGNASGSFAGNFFNFTTGGTSYGSLTSAGNFSAGGTGTFGTLSANQVSIKGGAAGTSVEIDASGSDTNINLLLAAKGSNGIFLRSNGGNVIQASSNTIGAPNYWGFLPATPGFAPQMYVQGIDADVAMWLKTKGAAGIFVTPGSDVATAFQVFNAAKTVAYLTVNTLDGSTSFGGVAKMKGYTVSTLPAAPGQGARAFVTDAALCSFLGALTGGGSTYCPVNYNGNAWVGG